CARRWLRIDLNWLSALLYALSASDCGWVSDAGCAAAPDSKTCGMNKIPSTSVATLMLSRDDGGLIVVVPMAVCCASASVKCTGREANNARCPERRRNKLLAQHSVCG